MGNKIDLWRVTLDTNPDHCNLNCIMCEDHSPYSDDKLTRKKQGRLRSPMDRSLLEKVIREAKKLGVTEIIPSTMGEPLLYEHFEDFLSLCKELGLKLNLTTNGTFPRKSTEEWARKIVPITSDVKISWNGATEATQKKIMLKSILSEHISNAKAFIAVRDELKDLNYCSMTMQLTFIADNLEEIIDMVNLAIELGFDRVKGHQLWAHFDELKRQNIRGNSQLANRWNEIVKEAHSIVEKHNRSAERQIRLENFNELELDNLQDIAPGGECPFLGKEIWVDPSGRLNVCCAPDQQRKTLGDFGNINERTLNDILNSLAYTELMENYQEKELCKSCNMRRPK